MKVTRTALQNSASVATLLLTSDALIAEMPKDGKPLSSDEVSAALSDSSLAASNYLNAYRKIAALQPDDPNVQLELAQAAESSGDRGTAIAAYEQFLKLAPDDPNTTAVKQQIKRLKQ